MHSLPSASDFSPCVFFLIVIFTFIAISLLFTLTLASPLVFSHSHQTSHFYYSHLHYCQCASGGWWLALFRIPGNLATLEDGFDGLQLAFTFAVALDVAGRRLEVALGLLFGRASLLHSRADQKRLTENPLLVDHRAWLSLKQLCCSWRLSERGEVSQEQLRSQNLTTTLIALSAIISL